MAAQPWQWRRLSDEALETAVMKWLEIEGDAHYNHQERRAEAASKITSQILDEMNRRCIYPRLFNPDDGEVLYGAM